MRSFRSAGRDPLDGTDRAHWGAVAIGGRRPGRRPGRPFLLLLAVVVGIDAEQGEGQRAPRLLPRRGGGSGGWRGRWGRCARVGSEPACHKVAPVVEGGGGRLRRGGEGEVPENEVVVEERCGRQRERDGVHWHTWRDAVGGSPAECGGASNF
jgi:hypothetical protein